jgi:hypothetical protein
MYKPNDITKGDLTAINEKTVFFTVVGVVGSMKLHDLTEGGKAVGTYFFPMDQDTTAGMTFALKTAGDPLSLTSAVRGDKLFKTDIASLSKPQGRVVMASSIAASSRPPSTPGAFAKKCLMPGSLRSAMRRRVSIRIS